MIKLEELDSYILEDVQSPSHPAEFIMQENYSALILRLPLVGKEEVEVESYAFIVQDDDIYLYDRKKESLEHLGSYDAMIAFLDEKIDILLKEIQQYHYKIELLEDSLYEDNVSESFMQQWLEYKKALSLIYRVMFHTTLAYELFLKHYKHKEGFPILAYEDILEHKRRISNLAHAAKEKLDNLYDFYRAKVDEKMNKNMYYLTIISGIFLPLTLITGFFGMNTSGLPYTDGSDGTIKAVIVSVILEAVFLVPFILMNKQRFKK